MIGNSAYEHGFTLYNPGRDATAMSRLLTEVGFEVDTVRDLDGAAMHAVIGSFSRRSKGADVALVYFAGNGLLVDGEDWLLGVNAQPGELHGPATAVGGNRLMQSLAGAKARVLILDSCRDDGLRSTLVR